jgi:predicted phage terminase large subunit-like protein
LTGEAGFLGFARMVMGKAGMMPAAHHELLIERLQAVADGRCDRLMVQMPPGSAKSTYGSILFAAYFVGRFPRGQIIAAEHTASLAHYFGRRVRGVLGEFGGELGVALASDSRAAGQFRLAQGAEYFAAGVRGPITGRRADLVIVDDPIKSWAEAESATLRDGLFDWYRAELSARLKPGGRVVLIMTRWHPGDLAGRLAEAETGWECLRLPALAEAGDVLGRAVGAALWPAWADEAAIARRRREVGERMFAAMYQQAPRAPDAALFDTAKIFVVEACPALLRSIRAWDLAASLPGAGRRPDWTVGLKLGLGGDGRLLVADLVRFQGSPAQVEARIVATARADGAATLIGLPQDPGQAGLAQVVMLKRALVGFAVEATPELGSKWARAMPAAIQMDAGSLGLVKGPWNGAFIAELAAFPEGDKDDQVDALSRAVTMMVTTSGQLTRRLSVPLLGR